MVVVKLTSFEIKTTNFIILLSNANGLHKKAKKVTLFTKCFANCTQFEVLLMNERKPSEWKTEHQKNQL